MIERQLLKGKSIHLARIDPEKDSLQEAQWSANLHYAALMQKDPLHPISPAELKKKYEATAKSAADKRAEVHYAVRRLADDQLIGFFHLDWISWSNAVTEMRLVPADVVGLEGMAETLELGLQYCFNELNLHRVFIGLPETWHDLVNLLLQAGFTQDVCLRQNAFWNGALCDRLEFGLLRPEWMQRQTEVTA